MRALRCHYDQANERHVVPNDSTFFRVLGLIDPAHFEAIENGTHRVRDVTFREDACRVARPKAARNRVTLRNFAIGLYNLLRHCGKVTAPSLPSSQRSVKGAPRSSM